MKHFLSSFALLALLATGPLLSGCSKKDDPAAPATTGSVNGTVKLPEGSIKDGTMSWTVNGQTYTTTNVEGMASGPPNNLFRVTGIFGPCTQFKFVSLNAAESFTGTTGNYILNTNNSGASYQVYDAGVTDLLYGCKYSPGSSLTINRYDSATRTVGGTFNFTAIGGTRIPNSNNITGTDAITVSGTFSVRF